MGRFFSARLMEIPQHSKGVITCGGYITLLAERLGALGTPSDTISPSDIRLGATFIWNSKLFFAYGDRWVFKTRQMDDS